MRNNPLAFVDPSGFAGEGVVRQPGFPDVPLPNDVVTPSVSFLISQDVRAQLVHPIEPTGTGAPTNDTSTTGTGDAVVLPVMESDHPSGPGTDDPFGVYPPDLTLGYAEPITVFDELVAGDPAGGRRTFIIQDDPGIGRDIRIAFGVDRETIMLRPRIGGSGIDDRQLAKDRLIGEGVLAAATLLTPGPLDDIAVAGAARLARAAGNLNKSTAVSEFGVYEIGVNKELYKVGKADLLRVTKSSGDPTRIHQQLRKLVELHGHKNVDYMLEQLGRVTTANAKAAERARLYEYYRSTGKIPPGNKKSFRP